jgi:hypothetical protein
MATTEEIVAKRMAGKTPSAKGTYIKNGKGRLIVKELRLKNTREGLGFFGTFQVLTSVDTDPTQKADAPGVTVSWAQFYDKFPDSAPGNVVGFLAALTGEPMSEFNVEANLLKHIGKLTGPDQPMRGAVVDYEGKTIITKAKRIPITVVDFATAEQTTDQIKARRAELGPYLYTADAA